MLRFDLAVRGPVGISHSCRQDCIVHHAGDTRVARCRSDRRQGQTRCQPDPLERLSTVGVRELCRGITPGPEQYKSADPCIKKSLAALRRYHLALAKAFRYGALPLAIDRILLRGVGPVAELLWDVPLLRTLKDTIAPLQKVLSRLQRFVVLGPSDLPQGSQQLCDALERILTLYRQKTDELTPRVAALKVGSRRKYNLTREAFVGDRAVEVYRLLADCIPLERQWAGRRPDAAKYNQAALRLTAELVNAAYQLHAHHDDQPRIHPNDLPHLQRELTARDIKSRLQQRIKNWV